MCGVGNYLLSVLLQITGTKAACYRHCITDIIIYMIKLLDSDWLRAVQFKCNTSAKRVTPVQITHRNSGL